MQRNGSPYGSFSSHDGSVWSSASQGETSSQFSSSSRPSGKLIYRRRKEFAESIQRRPGSFQHLVEHLLTCELDDRDVSSVDDYLDRLILLHAKGQIWGQDVTLAIHQNKLQITDIETKEELEILDLEDIVEMKAVLGRCVYDSLLMVTVKREPSGEGSSFLFQCEEVGAEYVRIDLERALKHWRAEVGDKQSHRDLNKSQEARNVKEPKTFQKPSLPPHLYEEHSDFSSVDECSDVGMEDWRLVDDIPTPPATPRVFGEQAEVMADSKLPTEPRFYTETERNVDILNHLLDDLELFMDKVAAALPREKTRKKMKIMKNKKSKVSKAMPPEEEFKSYLHKVKYGFNILGDLNGEIDNPSAVDLIHSLFSILSFLLPHCDPQLPSTVLSPLLTDQVIRLMSSEATQEEDNLWQTLGDPWNIPRSKWPDDDVPPYIPHFNDGWQPAPVVKESQRIMPTRGVQHQPSQPTSNTPPKEHLSKAAERPPQQQPKNIKPSRAPANKENQSKPPERHLQQEPKMKPMADATSKQEMPVKETKPSSREKEPQNRLRENSRWSAPTSYNQGTPVYKRVLYDFMGRNRQELSVTKGDVVQVLDQSRQWWKVHVNGKEGYVPYNVLEPLDGGSGTMNVQNPQMTPNLTRKSRPEDVKAWLEYKDFSHITVRCLSVLSGSLLLGMTREELKTMCPEEGGRVFSQLQAIRS